MTENVPRTRVVLYQEDGTALVLKWLDTLPRKAQTKCQAYLLQLEEFGHELKRPIAAYLRDGIHELRPSYQGVQYRLLYFFGGSGEGQARGRDQDRGGLPRLGKRAGRAGG